jgi:MFS family permease
MTAAVFCQIFGLLGLQTIEQNGLFVLYLRRLGVPASGALGLLSLFSIIVAVTRIPVSHAADRIGRKRIGTAGTLVGTAALAGVALAGSLPESWVRVAAMTGLVLFAVGEAFFAAGWFSMLHPIIPEHRRGTFFGVLRVSWQVVGVGFAAVASVLLERNPSVATYQLVFAAVAAGALGRALLYRLLPEMEPAHTDRPAVLPALSRVLRRSEFRGYLVYILVRFLFAGSAVQVLALLEREAIGLSDGIVVTLANFGLGGNIAGFIAGAFIVDRLGRRPLFVGTHLTAAIVLLAFPARILVADLPIVAVYATLHALLGFAIASFTVAMTAEEFSLSHVESKALALSFTGFAFIGGRAASRLASSFLLRSSGLPEQLSLGAFSLSSYDLVVMILGVGLLASVPLLRLVPAVRYRR